MLSSGTSGLLLRTLLSTYSVHSFAHSLTFSGAPSPLPPGVSLASRHPSERVGWSTSITFHPHLLTLFECSSSDALMPRLGTDVCSLLHMSKRQSSVTSLAAKSEAAQSEACPAPSRLVYRLSGAYISMQACVTLILAPLFPPSLRFILCVPDKPGVDRRTDRYLDACRIWVSDRGTEYF